MTSAKGAPGPFDGMERAQPGEPVFTLRAHDPLAARLVKVWVWLRRRAIRKAHAAGDINDEKRDLELVQCREAEEIAFSMDEWRGGEAGAAPVEAEEPETKHYSGVDLGEDKMNAQRLWQARKKLERDCSNAEAEITDAAAALAEWGFAGTIALARAATDAVRAVRDRVAPKAGYSTVDLDKEWD